MEKPRAKPVNVGALRIGTCAAQQSMPTLLQVFGMKLATFKLGSKRRRHSKSDAMSRLAIILAAGIQCWSIGYMLAPDARRWATSRRLVKRSTSMFGKHRKELSSLNVDYMLLNVKNATMVAEDVYPDCRRWATSRRQLGRGG